MSAPVKFAAFSKGERVQVSKEGARNGIAVRRHGRARTGFVVRAAGDSVDVRWEGNRGVYSIHASFIERVSGGKP